MNPNEYQKAAMRTVSSLAQHELMLNGIMGLNGEAGEIADYYKKSRFQGHELNREHLAEELGDLLWYVATFAEGIGYKLEDVMKMNIEKLKKRYPNGFEVERSINR